jgi:hypothetical protein
MNDVTQTDTAIDDNAPHSGSFNKSFKGKFTKAQLLEEAEASKPETKSFLTKTIVHHNGAAVASNTFISLTEAEFNSLSLIGAIEGDSF